MLIPAKETTCRVFNQYGPRCLEVMHSLSLDSKEQVSSQRLRVILPL